jgi:anti-sigma regulatory factor (Ser/Thr protein kinase)
LSTSRAYLNRASQQALAGLRAPPPPEIVSPPADQQANPRELVRLLMRSDASAPRRAREALEALEAIDPVRDDAVLVASELVSNAVLHAGCDASDEIELLAELRPAVLRLTITDRGRSGKLPKVRGAEYRGPGGRGLRVVQALARRWGSERRKGTVVWAELPLDAAGAQSAGGSDPSRHAARGGSAP